MFSLNVVFSLFSIRAMGNLKRTSNASDFFEGVSLGGGAVHLFPGGRSVALSESNRGFFADLALRQRLRELQPQESVVTVVFRKGETVRLVCISGKMPVKRLHEMQSENTLM